MNNLTEQDINLFCQPDPIGLVSPSKSHHITPNEFTFWISMISPAKFQLQLGDIIVAKYITNTQKDLWDGEDKSDATFGIVTAMTRASDVDSPLIDYIRHGYGKKPKSANKTDPLDVLIVTCKFLRSLTGRMRPVDCCPVHFTTTLGIKFATQEVKQDGSPQMDGNWIPTGQYTTGYGIKSPLCCNENFVLGADAAHVNVTGQSGMASKTSYLLFFLSSVLQKTSKKVGVVFVNVKKSDFLWIDTPNPLLTPERIAEYTDLGLKPELPLNNIEFWAPIHKSGEHSEVKSLRQKARGDVKGIQIAWGDFKKSIPAILSTDLDIKAENVLNNIIDIVGRDGTFEEAVKAGNDMLSSSKKKDDHEATIRKVCGRLGGLQKTFKEILDPTSSKSLFPDPSKLKHKDAIVLDIGLVKDVRTQQIIFKEVLIRCERALQDDSIPDKLDAIIIVADELNAFCPASSDSSAPLRTQIIDIAARGRSLGFILFGAQQAASNVAKEVYGAAAVKVIGRTGPEEITAGIYKFLPDDLKGQITKQQQGTMILAMTTCSEYLPITFPYPPVMTDSTKAALPKNKPESNPVSTEFKE